MWARLFSVRTMKARNFIPTFWQFVAICLTLLSNFSLFPYSSSRLSLSAPMKSLFALLFAPFLLTSCIHLQCTKHTYEHVLTSAERARIVFAGKDSTFRPEQLRTSLTTVHEGRLQAQRRLYLVNGQQFRQALAQGKWQVVYICLPYCGGEHCISYAQFCKEAGEHQVQPWVVLRDPCNGEIVNSVDRYPLVGMDYRYYNKLLCSRKFFADMGHSAPNWKERYDGNLFFLFHGDNLVAESNDLANLWAHVR